jgi:hypothetical protein
MVDISLMLVKAEYGVDIFYCFNNRGRIRRIFELCKLLVYIGLVHDLALLHSNTPKLTVHPQELVGLPTQLGVDLRSQFLVVF